MAFYLTANAQREITVRCTLQIPRQIRRHHWAASEGNRDTGAQFKTAGMGRRNRQRQKRILTIFLSGYAAEAVSLCRLRRGANSVEVVRRYSGIDLHGPNFNRFRFNC